METYPEKLGKTTIDITVLTNIAKLTSLSVPGVSKMSTGPHSVNSLIKKNYFDGVMIEENGLNDRGEIHEEAAQDGEFV